MNNVDVIGAGPTRVVLAILDGFLGVTALLGGIALLTSWISPPIAVLAGSPFRSYVIPGLALLLLVGGSALVATVLLVGRRALGAVVSGVAGTTILGYESVELAVIGFSWLLAFYLALGVAILALATRRWLAGRAAPTEATDPNQSSDAATA